MGSTPKQLFHAWMTFKFDKNTDTIDSYILRMSQVATMLNYGEMQNLENFKNTSLYQLYLTLINVNNLRDAIDLAKRSTDKGEIRQTADWTIPPPHSWESPVMTNIPCKLITKEEWLSMQWKL